MREIRMDKNTAKIFIGLAHLPELILEKYGSKHVFIGVVKKNLLALIGSKNAEIRKLV